MASTVSSQHYLRLLEPWLKSSEQYIYTPVDRPDLECYGTGYHNWGVQTNQKALSAFAVCAADPDFDESTAGMCREAALEHAIKMLRFSLESHIEGSYFCTDGTKWGHFWISPLGIERMMHAVEAIEEHVTPHDLELLRKVLVSESTWLLNDYEIVAGPVAKQGKNKPESNMWNGAIMLRTACMYPDEPLAEDFREKGIRFLINAVSVSSDADSHDIVDEKPISERYVGANFFDSYALNHHGYLNVGYMVICLSNAAMLYFMYKKKNLEPPQALFHHVKNLWGLVKHFTFPDGRLLRIGGDTRIRYCYCQDYGIPSWLMIEECFKDLDCIQFEASWLEHINRETEYNGDGSFLSARCGDLKNASPLYYTRVESDRAVTLSMGAYWRRVLDIPSDKPGSSDNKTISISWHDEFHGAVFHKSNKRIASWVWQAGERPQGMLLVPDKSDMAEWRENCAGEIRGEGSLNFQEVISHKEEQFDGGFLTWGTTAVNSHEMIGEGQKDEHGLAIQKLVYAALPDDTTIIILQHAQTSGNRTNLTSVKGLHYVVPNDLFNGDSRTYYSAEGKHEIKRLEGKEEILNFHSSWINIEDCIGIMLLYGEDELSLYRPGKRQIGLKHYPSPSNWRAGGMLYADEICAPCRRAMHSAAPGTVLYDIGVVMQAGATRKKTADLAGAGKCTRIETPSAPQLRAVSVQGSDSIPYILIANLDEKSVTQNINIAEGEQAVNVVSKEIIGIKAGSFHLEIDGSEAILFRIEY